MPRLLSILLLVLLVPAAYAQAPRSEVFVVATLYGRHAGTPAYGHDTLGAIIERVAPSAVVLDVSPRELRDQTVHPSKAEYPEVIFPLVRERGWQAYAGEPDEPRFTEIVSRLGKSLAAFRESRPEAAASRGAPSVQTPFPVAFRVWPPRNAARAGTPRPT